MSVDSVISCMNLKLSEVNRIAKRMQDPEIANKLRLKVRPDLLEKEVARFTETYNQIKADVEAGIRDISDGELGIMKEALDESIFQMKRRQGQAVHQAGVIRKQRAAVQSFLEDGITRPSSIIQGILHLTNRNSANSLGGAIQGWTDALNTRLGNVWTKLTDKTKLVFKDSDIHVGQELGREIFDRSKGASKYTGTNKDIPMMTDELGLLFDDIVDGLYTRGMDTKALNSFEYMLGADTDISLVGAMKKEQFVDEAMTISDAIDWEAVAARAKKQGSTEFFDGNNNFDRKAFLEDYYLKKVYGEFEDGSDGAIKSMISVVESSAVSKVARGREKARILVFKNFDGWSTWSKKFGNGGNFVDHLASTVNKSARTLGILDTFGANPNLTLKHIMGAVQDNYGEILTGKQMGEIQKELVDGFRFYAGRMQNNLSYKTQSIIRGIKNTTRGAFLGSDSLSAITTESNGLLPRAMTLIGTDAGTAVFSGLKAITTSNNYEGALRSMVYLDDVIQELRGNYNNTYATGFEKISRYGSNAVDHLSATNIISHRNKAFLHSAFEHALTDYIKNNLDGTILRILDDFVDAPMSQWLRLHGITDKDLSVLAKYIKKVGDDYRGAHVFDFSDVKPSSPEYQSIVKYNSVKRAFQETGSPGQNQRIAYTMAKHAEKGGAAGALAQFIQFASYVDSVYRMVGSRLLSDTSPAGVARTAAFITWVTLLGMADIQLRNLVQFRSPREADESLVLEGFMRAGLGGVMGDFMLSSAQRPTSGLLDRFFPALGPVKDTISGANRQVKRISEGKFTSSDLGYSLFSGASSLLPGSNLWFTRALIDRAIKDNIKEAIDPKRYRDEVKRDTRRLKKNGQTRYWERGDYLPNR